MLKPNPALAIRRSTHTSRDTVVVAWKDRPEAVRAIVAAAPFLAKAKLVRVVHLAETDQDESSLTEITNYLCRAGVAAEATSVPQRSRGSRYDVMDADVSGLGVRVTDRGLRTFILIARYPGSKNPTRRALGEYPTLTLEKAPEVLPFFEIAFSLASVRA